MPGGVIRPRILRLFWLAIHLRNRLEPAQLPAEQASFFLARSLVAEVLMTAIRIDTIERKCG